MSFSNPFGTKTNDVSTVTATELNTAGASIANAFDVSGSNTVSGTATFNGALTMAALVTHSGSSGRTAKRYDTSTLIDANATVDVSKDVWAATVAVNSLRVWTLRHSTSPVPTAGEMITITKIASGSSVDIKREDATVVASLGTAWSSATVIYTGSVWRLHSMAGGTTAGAGA